MQIKNILIIGAGWYGCHIGVYLKKLGHHVKIFEKNKDIFQGSSGYNQFRLHTGFHYPRSSETINEIQENYKKFIKVYKKFIFFPKNNIYCIAKKKSLIDSKTYELILKYHRLKFKKIKIPFLQNVEAIYNCNEAVIMNEKLIKFYKKELKKNIYLNKQVNDISVYEKKYDFVIDCTNATWQNKLDLNFDYVLTISLIYKKIKNSLILPVTIMDGSLPSLYPYADKNDFFTLTHSNFTHIKKFKSFKKLIGFKKKINNDKIQTIKSRMEKSIMFFIKDFKKKLKYKDYFLSYKVLPNEESDKRATYINRNKNIISCTSPKIINIFTFEKYVAAIINEQ
jgi:hypothetical protein